MNQKKKIEKIARGRISQLFLEARKVSMKNLKLATRYVEIARKIAMKARIPVPRIYKRKFCKHCKTYFNSSNVRIRTKNKKVIHYCLNCRKYTRYPFIKERKERLINSRKKQK